MANIWNYEADIQRCNDALLQTFADYAQTGENINFADVVARYAYDTVFVTTIGEPAGFLQRNLDVARIKGALERWKFTAILCGTYFRFHPFITRLACSLQPDNLQSVVAEHLHSGPSDHTNITSDAKSHSTLEACVALMIAGADPAITHILAALLCIYQDEEVLEKIRAEIKAARLSQPPTIKELLYAAPRMPYLHAALHESLRLICPHSGYTFAVPEGGCSIMYKDVAEGVSSSMSSCICLSPRLSQAQVQVRAPAYRTCH